MRRPGRAAAWRKRRARSRARFLFSSVCSPCGAPMIRCAHEPATRTAAMNDLVIRGATVYDGTGDEAWVGDVCILNGRISEVKKAGSRSQTVLDASGLALMPGIVDVHTHYDAQ